MKDIIKEDLDSTTSHSEWGMYVLAVMSHGSKETLHGVKDSRGVEGDLTQEEVVNMLSASRFPAMAGKPKVLIFNACSGCE